MVGRPAALRRRRPGYSRCALGSQEGGKALRMPGPPRPTAGSSSTPRHRPFRCFAAESSSSAFATFPSVAVALPSTGSAATARRRSAPSESTEFNQDPDTLSSLGSTFRGPSMPAARSTWDGSMLMTTSESKQHSREVSHRHKIRRWADSSAFTAWARAARASTKRSTGPRGASPSAMLRSEGCHV